MQSIFFGVVEDIKDPHKIGRCRVRVMGVHSPMLGDLPVEDLPWATPIQNNSASMNGIGTSSTEYVQGSTVAVIFTDEDLQIPLILGSIGGVPDKVTTVYASIEYDVASTPPDSPPDDVYMLTDGSYIDPKTQDVPAGAVKVELPYIGTLTRSDVTKLMGRLKAIRDHKNIDTPHGIGYYQFTQDDLRNLGYIGTSGQLDSGMNGIRSRKAFIANMNNQDDAEETLMKLNYIALRKVGVISDASPKEKVAGLLMAAQVEGVLRVHDYVTKQTDYTNILGEVVSEFYKAGYATVLGKPTTEHPTLENVRQEASDKYESRSDISRSKFDVKETPEPQLRQGFKDPSGKYPLWTNESDTSRLAANTNVFETIVGYKEAVAVKSVSVANSSKTWQQSPIPYNASYPNNTVYQTESGHVMEFDDTAGSERINIHHRAGTFWEVDSQGNATDRTMGIRTVIVDKDELVYIKGSGHVCVDGDMSLLVKNALQIQVNGDANFDVAGTFNVKASSFNVEASTINLGGTTINMDGSGSVNIGGGVTTIGVPGVLSVAGSNASATAHGSIKLGAYNPVISIAKPITRSALQEIEFEESNTAKYLLKSHPTAPATTVTVDKKPANRSVTATKHVEVTEDVIRLSTQLSANYRVKDLCAGKLGAMIADPVKPQHGQSAKQLANNMKGLAINVLEPIREHFGYLGMNVNSGLRPAGNPLSAKNGNTSQHEFGMAVDISFSKLWGTETEREDMMKIAQWIRDNIIFDQLILEYIDKGKQCWIHISFDVNRKNSQRGNMYTYNNHELLRDGVGALVQLA